MALHRLLLTCHLGIKKDFESVDLPELMNSSRIIDRRVYRRHASQSKRSFS